MNRPFFVFVGNRGQRALGGWADYLDRFNSLEEAKTFLLQRLGGFQWWEIVDVNSGAVVLRGGGRL